MTQQQRSKQAWAKWRKLVAERGRSGETVTAFCRKRRLCVPAHLQRATLQRLRQRLFLVPSQPVRPGGTPTLRIAPSYPYVADFVETLRRIRRLRSRLRAT
jgi:hypothetical protein